MKYSDIILPSDLQTNVMIFATKHAKTLFCEVFWKEVPEQHKTNLHKNCKNYKKYNIFDNIEMLLRMN